MLSFPLRNYTLLSFCVFEKKFYLRKLLNFHKIVIQKFKNKFINSSIKNIKRVVLTKLKEKLNKQGKQLILKTLKYWMSADSQPHIFSKTKLSLIPPNLPHCDTEEC